MAVSFIAYISACEHLSKDKGSLLDSVTANLREHFATVVESGLAMWIGAYVVSCRARPQRAPARALPCPSRARLPPFRSVPLRLLRQVNPRVPHRQVLLVCRLEQLAHAAYLARIAGEMVKAK
jgi:hypothetical protein